MTSENPQENPNSPSDQGQPNKDANGAETQVPPRVAKLEPPIAHNKCQETCKTHKHWLDYATFVVEILGLIGLGIYALLTYGIWCANKKSADNSTQTLNTIQKQFQLDQRPYIAIMNYGVGHVRNRKSIYGTPVRNEPVFVSVNFKNIGKSAARNNIIHRHLLFGSEASKFRIDPPDTNPGTTADPDVPKINESAVVHPSELVNWNQDVYGLTCCLPYAGIVMNGNVVLNMGDVFGHKINEMCPAGSEPN